MQLTPGFFPVKFCGEKTRKSSGKFPQVGASRWEVAGSSCQFTTISSVSKFSPLVGFDKNCKATVKVGGLPARVGYSEGRRKVNAIPQRTRILVIDDDRKLCRLIAEYLMPMGYDVALVHTGPEGVQRAISEAWSAVILDVMLPGMDGFEVLKQIRKTSEVPVLMLTARGEEADRIVGLEIGADDYLPKTFSTRELLARLRAVTRRATRSAKANGEERESKIVVGSLRVDPNTRTAAFRDEPLTLTPVEYDLLASLVRARGRVKTREQLLEECRDRNYEVFDRSIDVHISALRKKLGDDAKEPRFIKTIRSAGYMFINPDEAS
jgi:two-component system response regulator CpxR